MSSLYESEEELLQEFEPLWQEAEEIWEDNILESDFQGYVSSDYPAVFQQLYALRGQIDSVLEWGSGLGVVTLMAARMGFAAYGIESVLRLVQISETLLEKYQSDATIVHGSFIPTDFEWEPELGDEFQGTEMEVASAYEILDMELRDFDLVFAYPWPDEHSLFHTIMREYGSRHALMLTYDNREGLQLLKVSDL